jgi:hypothetical protein
MVAPNCTLNSLKQMTMNIDEFEAFKIARIAAHDRGWQWRPPFWISLDEGE